MNFSRQLHARTVLFLDLISQEIAAIDEFEQSCLEKQTVLPPKGMSVLSNSILLIEGARGQDDENLHSTSVVIGYYGE